MSISARHTVIQLVIWACCVAGQDLRLEGEVNNVPDVNGLRRYMSIALAPDDNFLYVGATPTREFGSSVLSWFSCEKDTCCALSYGGLLDATQVPPIDGIFRVFLPSATGEVVYSLSLYGSLCSFRRNTTTGVVTWIGGIMKDGSDAKGLSDVRDFSATADGTRLVVACKDTLLWFQSNPATGVVQFAGAVAQGIGATQGLANPTAIAVTADGSVAYICGKNPVTIAWFTWQGNGYEFGGVLVDSLQGDTTITAPVRIVLSPDERFIYVTVVYNGRLVWYRKNESTAAIERAGMLRNINAQGVSSNPRGLAISSDGRYIYVANMWGKEISCLYRDTLTGALTRADSAAADFTVWDICAARTRPCLYAAAENRLFWYSVVSSASAKSSTYIGVIAPRAATPFVCRITDIRGRNVSSSAPPQGVYLSGARHGRLILRKAFVR